MLHAAALSTVLLGVWIVVGSAPAKACTACACGSSAALPMGTEVPYAERLRTGVVLQTASTRETGSLGTSTALASNLVGVLLWAPWRGLMVDAALPLGGRLQWHDDALEGRSVGLGDVDVGARLLWQNRGFAPTLMAGVRLGARLPTTTWLRRDDGASRPRALQPGLGEVGGALQLQGAYAPNPTTTVVATVDGLVPLVSVYDDRHSGALVEARLLALWRFHPSASLRGGVLGRHVGDDVVTDPDAGTDNKVAVPQSTARQSLLVETGVSLDLTSSTQLALTVAIPAWQTGKVQDGPRITTALVFDW